ncbi:MAG: hypothetical protein ACSLFR_05630, partial [Solirubrobacteraceae bacterium]
MEHRSNLLARVRWGNVARVLALVALAVIIGAWPRLRGAEPALPPTAAEPVVAVPAPAPAPAPHPTAAPEREPKRVERTPERRPAPRRKALKRRRAKAPKPTTPPAAVPTPAPV